MRKRACVVLGTLLLYIILLSNENSRDAIFRCDLFYKRIENPDAENKALVHKSVRRFLSIHVVVGTHLIVVACALKSQKYFLFFSWLACAGSRLSIFLDKPLMVRNIAFSSLIWARAKIAKNLSGDTACNYGSELQG